MIIPTEENKISNKKLLLDIKKLLPKITIIALREDRLGLYIYIKIPIVYHNYIEKLDGILPWLERPRFHIHYTNIFCKSESVDESMEKLLINIYNLKWMMSLYITLDDIYIKNKAYPLIFLLNYIRCSRKELPHINGIFNLDFVNNYKSMEDKIINEIHYNIPNLQFIITNKKIINTHFIVDNNHSYHQIF